VLFLGEKFLCRLLKIQTVSKSLSANFGLTKSSYIVRAMFVTEAAKRYCIIAATTISIINYTSLPGDYENTNADGSFFTRFSIHYRVFLSTLSAAINFPGAHTQGEI